jgi:hypothetical protein
VRAPRSPIRQRDIADILLELREPTSVAGSALVAQRGR